MKHLKTLLLIGCFLFLGVTLMTPKALAGESNQKTVLNFEQPVQLPGVVLPAGTYIFKLVSLTTDRDVVQVLSPDETKVFATIMTVPSFKENATEDTLVVFEERSAGEPQAIKEWFFPDRRYGHEFIYSKKAPSELAKAEPASSTQPSESSAPAFADEKYEPTMQSEEGDYMNLLHQKQMPEIAESNQQTDINNPAENSESNWEKPQEQAPVQSAMARELPRTASHLPLVFLSGILLVAFSFALRFTS